MSARRPGRPAGRPSAGSGEDTADQILRVAGRLFSEQGYDATSTRQIAEAAGVRQPTLFHHFGSKSDILRAISRKALLVPIQHLAEVEEAGGSPAARLYSIVHFQVYHLAAQPHELSAALYAHLGISQEEHPEWFRDVRTYTAGFRRVIEAGVEAGEFRSDLDPTATTMFLLGMANWTLRWYRPGGALSPADVADQCATLALRGVLLDPARYFEAAMKRAWMQAGDDQQIPS